VTEVSMASAVGGSQASAEAVLASTHALCPVCLVVCPGQVIDRAGKVKGRASLALRFDSISAAGDVYQIDARFARTNDSYCGPSAQVGVFFALRRSNFDVRT